MKESFRQCMAWLHTWTGLVTGWVLFFVFVTGTAGYVDDEITRWMEPERPLAQFVAQADPSAAIDHALTRLEYVAPQAKSWTITLPHESLEPRGPRSLAVSWEALPAHGNRFGARGSEKLDAATGEVVHEVEPRATGGGNRLYRMHYLLHYLDRDLAIRLVGVCTMLMLLAVITGVITHKKIFTDFFTFRPGKGQRSWLDAHNVVSVMSLPFFLMITYTGLVFFAIQYLPAGRDIVYGTSDADRRAFFEEIRGFDNEPHLPVGRPQASLADMVARAQTQWGAGQVASLQMLHPQGETPYVDVYRVAGRQVNIYAPETLRFSAIDGASLRDGDPTSAVRQTQRTLFALHEGLFANWWLRWLYFISGLMGCAVIGTGLVLWTVKRRTQHQQRVARAGADSFTARFNAGGLRLVEVLNAGTLAGLPLGLAAYFWANRLLPVWIADRAQWEVHAMFLVWGWALLYASLRPLKPAWIELLVLTSLAYALLPVLNALTTDRHLGVTLSHPDWVLAGFDLTMLGLAAVFAYIAVKLRRKWRVIERAHAPGRPKRESPLGEGSRGDGSVVQ